MKTKSIIKALHGKERLKGSSTKEIDCRCPIVPQPMKNLTRALKMELFREDLFHRINEFSVKFRVSGGTAIEDFATICGYLFKAKPNISLGKKVEGFLKDVRNI